MTPNRLVRLILACLIAVSAISLFCSTILAMGMGTFLADSVYLPLREFVEPNRQHAMEEKVIDMWDTYHRRQGVVSIARDGFILAGLVAVRLLLSRIEFKLPSSESPH